MPNSYSLHIVKQRSKITSLGEKFVVLALRSKKGKIKKEKSFVEIPIDDWCEDNYIKKSKRDKYTNLLTDIAEVNARIPEYKRKLNTGLIDQENAIIECLGLQKVVEGEVLEYTKQLEPKRYTNTKLTQSRIRNLIGRIRAMERKLPTKYVPLTFDILQNEYDVKQIAEILFDSKLSEATINKYMSAIDKVCSIKSERKFTPFKSLELIPYPKHVGKQESVPFRQIEEALNEVNTLQDLEAYLIWIYSFCLLGMNYTDMFNIDEKKIMQEDYEWKPYHPEVQGYQVPIHIHYFRGKLSDRDRKKAPIIRMINVAPIYLIIEMLRHIVKKTRPEYAYNGRDKLRIYNFYTKDEDYNEIPEGVAKKEAIRSTYYKKWKQMFGHSITHTRATSMKAGRNVGASFEELEAQLGHVTGVSKVFNTYYSAEQKAVDTNHIFALMDYDIMQILRYIHKKFNNTDYLPKSIHVPEDVGGLYDFPLSLLSAKEYQEMQELMSQQGDTSSFNAETGRIEYEKANPMNYPKRLKSLIDKQHKLQYIHLAGEDTFDEWTEYVNSELDI
jgi:hypothetical protein